jgi:hypothetical protein
MKSLFSKQTIAFLTFAFAAFSVNAQYTETFEAQTPYVDTLTSNGQPFSLTGAFNIYSSRNGIGYQESNRFIDNINSTGINQINSIKTSDGIQFSIKNLWLFTSKDGGNNPSTDGSIIIRGKRAGGTVFTITMTSGFNGSFGANTGFAYLDFTTLGGVDNSNVAIDEIEFQLQGNFNYLAIDNFTWAPQLILPVTLLSYSATLQPSGEVRLNWQTSAESNTSSFVVERSTDAVNFKPIANVKAAGSSHSNINYSAIDATPLEGISYYRLLGYDIDGKMKQLGIKAIKNSKNNEHASIYPNPATGSSIHVKLVSANTSNLYIIADMSGKIVKTGIINSSRQPVDISQLTAGNYIMKLSDGQVIKWVKN